MGSIEARDGTRLDVQVYGGGAALLLVPGLGGSARVWGPFPRAMGAHFKTIAFDPRGFGGSKAPPSSITMDSMVSDILDVLDGLGVARSHIFGVSMGGVVAQRFAARHPERTDRLVLVSTTGRMTRWSGRMLDLFETLARKLSPGEWAAAMATLSLSPAWVESKAGRPADFERGLLPEHTEMPCILAQIAALRSLTSEDRAAMPAAPALVIGGKSDAITPFSAAEHMSASMPGSRLLALEGGHACLVERTEEGLLEILSFLKGRS